MIDTQAIRSKILDQAMRGQLTEQSPEDGTAQELYQRVCSEKQALIRAGLIKKEKPLAEIAIEEIPFEIPDSWQWVRLKSICTKIVDGDHNPPSGVAETSDYLMLSAQNINNGRLCNFDKVRYLTEDVFNEENKRTRLQVNDVLLTIVGTIGRSCVYEGGYNICFQRSVSVITTLIIPKYLKYALDIPFIQNFMEASSTGAAQLGFYLNKLEKLPIPLPPLNEQQRIVERIDQVFSILDTIDELQAQYTNNLTVLKSKLIDAAIQGKLTEQLPEDGTAEELYQQIQAVKKEQIKTGKVKKEKALPDISDDEIPFSIPDNWKWVRWGELSNQIQYGYNAPAKNRGRIRMVRITDIQGNRVNWQTVPFCDIDEDEIEEYKLHPHDILFARTGGTVGKSYLVESVEEDSVFAGYLIRTSYSLNLNAKYLKYFMDSRLYWKQLQDGTTATAQPNCNAKTLSKMMLPLPPREEQDRIVQVLDETIKVIEA